MEKKLTEVFVIVHIERESGHRRVYGDNKRQS